MRYNNYHKHSHYSNIRSLDVIVKPIDYIKRINVPCEMTGKEITEEINNSN